MKIEELIENQNAPLRAKMEKRGYHLNISKDKRKFFIDKEGKYVPYPVGYITGPGMSNGSYYMSVQGKNGWSQKSGLDILELKKWAVEKSKQNLAEI